MSDQHPSPRPSRAVSIILMISGAVLLLPGIGAGLCVVALGTIRLHKGIIYVCLAAGLVGLILIFWALERFGR